MTSSAASIPAWNSAGVLPPIRPNAPGSSPDRSPYVVDLAVLFDRFATSPERMAILDGLLRFRADLHAAGITSGFQWLDGSFLEQAEALEGRPPRDMDVVTFLDLPQGLDQRALAQHHGTLFDQKHVKAAYAMDAYFAVLGQPTDQWQVKKIAYWYSLWSHRRDGLWKGFVQVDLDPSQDGDARAILNLAGGVRHD
ncbi:hypothetical protein [Acidovorax sp.]|uniref:DUF6932 family protein n=1 Tax=Acidovorax sp. TaxID=1872122 RepID=UPI000BC45BA9|nr:hypothetical protein [Acidovorax sp.]OYW66315.1 MAG: hypothetical protein B7Z32_00535 [Hydrogenophilales bacterium 12-64-13]OYZ05889.1 MAG: hypothetical protein B7Y26_06085 [Hydrogenophilales bacterium 16-64-46]OZA39825.1 MAG: hypothetical protein B7X87_02110 [Hydrogenophilales bacterium 17-64-34]HQT00245.1 hypothetical protein [Thiobacillus sp.]